MEKKLLAIMTIVGLLLVGCGSESSSTSDKNSVLGVKVENNIAFLDLNKSKIDKTQTQFETSFTLQNNYNSEVGVKMRDFQLITTPCTVKSVSFSPSSIDFGTAKSKTVVAKAIFDEACTPKSYSFVGTSDLSFNSTSNTKIFSSDSITTNLTESNTTTNTNTTTPISPITLNYDIQLSLGNSNILAIESKKFVQVDLIDKDTNLSIADSNITSISVTSNQPSLAKLIDINANDQTPQESLTFENNNSQIFAIETSTISGLVDIETVIEYKDGKNQSKKMTKMISLSVMSGSPTAFSINDAGVTYNSETKWFEQKFMISATDKYNNKINQGSMINISAIADYTKDSTGKPILYGKFGTQKADIIKNSDNKTASLLTDSSIFDKIDSYRDILFVFGDVKSYEALGKWDIDSSSNFNSNTLKLKDNYVGENHTGLGFAIGHNYMEEPCSSDSREWVLQIDSTDGNYKLDSNGKAFVTSKFPSYMVGKKIALGVNFLGKTPETNKIVRSGEVYFKVLSSFDGLHAPDSIKVKKGTNGQVSVGFDIDTGTADKFTLKNALASCKVKVDNVAINSIQEHGLIKNSSACSDSNSEVVYWTLDLSSTSSTDDGTVTFSDCQVKDPYPSF
ncbi:MAG: hypothetical protein FNT15_07980 [Sulfurovum sp.]|nr:MAG: hypothetical protein FNT15_07980 [Sulfurovum sp.]